MKILRIIARLNVGGPARHVIWLTSELQDEEFQSTLIAGVVPGAEEDMGYFAAENNVVPVYVKEMSRELSAGDLISVLKIYRFIRRERPQIVHTHTAKAGTVGRLAAFLYRWLTWRTFVAKPRNIRTVHTFHGHVFHSYYGRFKTLLFLNIERVLARFATDRIIVIAKQQLAEINGDFGIGKRDKFRIIPLGIDIESFASDPDNRRTFRAEIGAADGDVVVGFVGRLTEIKNLSHLLQVAAMYNVVSTTEKPSIKFVIVGDGHLRETLMSEARELGVLNILSFLGNRIDAAKLYSGLDIVALTSLNEGTPLSLIEAMAAGRAVISTMAGGVVELLGEVRQEHDGFQERERGIGVDLISTQAFFEGLMFLAGNDGMRASLGSAGLEFVNERYDKGRLIDDIKGLYRELIEAD